MAHTRLRSSWFLPAILSTTAGAVDVIGFLALGGLFTAHITGNVVLIGLKWERTAALPSRAALQHGAHAGARK